MPPASNPMQQITEALGPDAFARSPDATPDAVLAAIMDMKSAAYWAWGKDHGQG